MLSTFPAEILVDIIQHLPLATIVSLSTLSKSWAAFTTTNESSIYRNLSRSYGYAPEGNSDTVAPAGGWKACFVRKFQTELRWIGKLPGSLRQVKARGKTGHFRRFKVDEEAGYLISTIIEGGLVVVDIHDNRILWSLDENSCVPSTHCEYDKGYIVFHRHDEYKEVWRRRTDIMNALGEKGWPSGPDNKPDGAMMKGHRAAERRYFDATRSKDPDHLRGQFVPWCRLRTPGDTLAFKLTGTTLLACGAQRAVLFDVETGELQESFEVDATAGLLRYIDFSEQHIFIVCTHRFSAYDRVTGSRVLVIPAGRQPWDFYANPENQWRREKETLNHGELGFRRAEPSSRTHRDDYFHAVHVSSCGKHLAIKAMSNRVILIQGFRRLLPTLSTSSPPTLVPSPVKLKDISKQVDFYAELPPSQPAPEGYLAYDRGKVAIIGTHGIYVLVLDSILDQLGDIKPHAKDISLRAIQPASPQHKPSWPNLRLCKVDFGNPRVLNKVMFLCLQLTETKLYFSLLHEQGLYGWDDNMWCYNFASSPQSAPTKGEGPEPGSVKNPITVLWPVVFSCFMLLFMFACASGFSLQAYARVAVLLLIAFLCFGGFQQGGPRDTGQDGNGEASGDR